MNRACVVIALLLAAAGAHAASASEAASATGLGRILFLRCASCHAVSQDAAARIGPNLKGVVGRKSASLAGYAYSPALKALNLVWTPVELDRWLTQPNAVAPGTTMAFAGIAKPEERHALISYLEHVGAGDAASAQPR